MSQADELLGSVSEPVLTLANTETEPHIVIGDDRVVTVPKELKRIAVQYDHDVETVTFDCPRYWDSLDMSQLDVYVNYMRKDREIGCYKAMNVVVDKIDSKLMHFDWTISRNVSLVKGELKFLVCIKKADEDGNEENHWNSELNSEMYISEGLETGETVIEPYPDILSQWDDEVQAVKDILLKARDSGELDGATFTPSVDADGNLSWTNDRGRDNPATVNIKGYSPAILVREIEGGRQLIITDSRQSQTVTIMDGKDGTDGAAGADGYSPAILVREIEGGRQLIITDSRQSQTVTIMDGADGKDGTNGVDGEDGEDGTNGADGYSPTVAVTEISGGHQVAITDAAGTKTFNVMDGTNDISAAVLEYMGTYMYVGEVEPTSGPTLWFDTSAQI